MILSVLDLEPGRSVKEQNECEKMKKTKQREISNYKVNVPSLVRPKVPVSEIETVILSVFDLEPGDSVREENECEKMKKTANTKYLITK